MGDIYLPKFLSHTMLFRKKFRIEKSRFEQWYLIMVESGSFEINILGKTHIIKDSEICVIPANCYFERRVIEPIYHHEILLSFSEADSLLQEAGQYLAGKLSVSDPGRLESTIRHIAHLYDAGKKDTELYQHFINDIWYQVYTDRVWHAHDTRRHLLYSAEDVGGEVGEVLDYFEEHFSEKIVLGDVAKSLGVSPVVLCRKFQKSIGCSPSSYLLRMRLQQGRCMVVDTDLTISLIAEMCGFENQFYFSNRFKKEYGMAPSVYRKESVLK